MNTQDQAHALLARYVHAVGENLPAKIRADVAAELRTLLEDALNERALAAGRPPDEDLAVAVLQEFGEPEEVAERYQPVPRYLIGPRLFPTFVLVAKIVSGALAGLLLVLFTLGVLGSPRKLPELFQLRNVGELLWHMIRLVAVNLGMLVLVFAIIERFQHARAIGAGMEGAEKPEPWNPRELPAVEDPERVSPVSRVWSVYWIVVLFVVLNFYQQYLGILLFTDHQVQAISFFAFGLKVPLMLLNLWWGLALALNLALLWDGRWSVGLRWAEFGLGVFGIYLLFLILTGSKWGEVNPDWLPQGEGTESNRLFQAALRNLPLLGRVASGILRIVLLIALI